MFKKAMIGLAAVAAVALVAARWTGPAGADGWHAPIEYKPYKMGEPQGGEGMMAIHQGDGWQAGFPKDPAFDKQVTHNAIYENLQLSPYGVANDSPDDIKTEEGRQWHIRMGIMYLVDYQQETFPYVWEALCDCARFMSRVEQNQLNAAEKEVWEVQKKMMEIMALKEQHDNAKAGGRLDDNLKKKFDAAWKEWRPLYEKLNQLLKQHGKQIDKFQSSLQDKGISPDFEENLTQVISQMRWSSVEKKIREAANDKSPGVRALANRLLQRCGLEAQKPMGVHLDKETFIQELGRIQKAGPTSADGMRILRRMQSDGIEGLKILIEIAKMGDAGLRSLALNAIYSLTGKSFKSVDEAEAHVAKLASAPQPEKKTGAEKKTEPEKTEKKTPEKREKKTITDE